MSADLWVHNGSLQLDQESEYKQIMAVSITLTIIMTVVVVLRAYVRGSLLKSLGGDDWAIFGGAVCTITYTGLCVGQTKWGLGLTIEARPELDLDQFTAINFAGKPIYMGGILGFKVALCLSYLRYLGNSSRRYSHIIWLVLVTCIAGHVGGILVLVFLCSPVAKSWKPLIEGHCIPNVNSVYGLGAMSILFDIVILLLPIRMFIRLQINNRKKVGVVGIFCLGIFTTFCSIMRLVQVKSILETGDQTGLVLWATVEMNIGITLTCLPTLLPLIKYYNDKKSSTAQESYSFDDTGGKQLGYLKSQNNRSAMSTDSSPGWQDRDNSSQKNILSLDSALEDDRSEESMRYGKTRILSGGIMARTEA